jgi:DNA invertase Pin-like site-specific DNA recombinase
MDEVLFHIFAVRAEFERELISETTKSGLAAARERGREGVGTSRPLDRGPRRVHVGTIPPPYGQ